ncbi:MULTISPECIES: SlyX family protein [unclassified Aurantimonas]|uniref:SlyX family protein n=1 Tax=unclassified Aurantimonas TaxID=2638230 RepID=UPI002E18CEA8|nr:SlyX family protein [Aurantimonas sp. A3-2-R12]
MSEKQAEISERIQDLEIMVAHQAQTIEELSEELRRAFETIERMQRSLKSLGHRFDTLEEVATPGPENTKPPHY